MNLAHLHLLMNHLPVIGIPISAIFLGFGLWTKQISLQKISLLIMMAISLLVIPVYLSGEPTEKLVEDIPGVSESLIEPHEDAAGLALGLTLVAGAFALVGTVASSKPKVFCLATRATLVFAILATLSLGYVANLGGQIRHSEIRTPSGETIPAEDHPKPPM